MKTLLISSLIAAVMFANSQAFAAPYCDALTDRNALAKKYQKIAPFYSDADQGWIIGNDQLKTDFSLSNEARFLLGRIVGKFKQYGVELAVVIPPPRPLFINTGETRLGSYDAQAAADSYNDYIQSLADIGFVSPNLLMPAKTMPKGKFYFLRDTHWTPEGSAISAIVLANTMGVVPDAERMFATLFFNEDYDETGSLSTVVNKICKQSLPPETVKAASFTQSGGALALLSDAPETAAKIALAGTSFSNRYGRDVYRFSDALSFALDAMVENYSISDGGMTSAIETLILSDAFKSGAYQTVVWEVPYTQKLSNISGLRQVLGAFVALENKRIKPVYKGRASGQWISVSFQVPTAGALAVSVTANSVGISQIDLELYAQDKRITRLKLRKSNRIPENRRSDLWTASLAGVDLEGVNRVKIRLKDVKTDQNITIQLIN